jgi:hypothetical protein
LGGSKQCLTNVGLRMVVKLSWDYL